MKKCLIAIENVVNKYFPDDKSIFYEGGKCFSRSLEYYADKTIPHQEFDETTEYLEAFLRNLLLNEKNELHNRNLHISELLNNKKVDIQDKKWTLRMIKWTFKTKSGY